MAELKLHETITAAVQKHVPSAIFPSSLGDDICRYLTNDRDLTGISVDYKIFFSHDGMLPLTANVWDLHGLVLAKAHQSRLTLRQSKKVADDVVAAARDADEITGWFGTLIRCQ